MPKINNLCPVLWRPLRDRPMIGPGECPESLRSGITIIESAAKFLRHHTILATDKYCHWSMIVAQIVFRGKSLHQQPRHRQDWRMVLPHVREPVIGREQHHARHCAGMRSGQIRRHPRAQRFAHQIHRPIRSDQPQPLVRRAKQTVLTRLTRAIGIPWILQDEHIQCCGLLDDIRIAGATSRATAVAIDQQDPAPRGLPRRQPFHPHRLPGGVPPAFELCSLGKTIHFFSRKHRRMINETPLAQSASDTSCQKKRNTNQERPAKSFCHGRSGVFGALSHEGNHSMGQISCTMSIQWIFI